MTPRAVSLARDGRSRVARVVTETSVACTVDVVAVWTRVHENRTVRSSVSKSCTVADHRREGTLYICFMTFQCEQKNQIDLTVFEE